MDPEKRDRYMLSPRLDTKQNMVNGSVRSLSTERLDAGLRSLDHCKHSLCRSSFFFSSLLFLLSLFFRQEQTSVMEVFSSTENHSFRSMGDSLFSHDAGFHAVFYP